MKQPLLNSFAKEVFEENKKRGFNVSKENLGQTLMLIVSELSEALEADRKDNYSQTQAFIDSAPINPNHETEENSFRSSFEYCIKDSFEDEIADTFIRLLDLVGGLNIDIDFHIKTKLHYNKTRAFKHGKKY